MSTIEIKKGIHWVGTIDWDIRHFHGPSYHTQKGTSYNAYLVVDEKIALVDIVDVDFVDEMLDKIKSVVDPSKIDYIIVNHVEPDHSGGFPKLMEYAPNAKVLCSKSGKDAMEHHYFGDYNYEVVKTGDEISLGEKTIQFIEAPMLHWPDSMFSYIKEESLLMPNDAFGQHLASSKLFDDENDLCEVMDEAKKYFANILMPFSPLVIKKIDEIVKMELKIDMIAPSHGIIWRSHPAEIIDKYLEWSKPTENRKAVVAYDTMWNSTEKMARKIVDGLASEGVNVKLYKVSETDINDIMTEVLDTKAILVASSTINNTMIPHVAYLLEELMGLKPRKKIGAAFGSYGWGKGAVANIEKKLKETGVELVKEGLQIRYVPDEENLEKCFEYGKEIGKLI